MVDREKYFPTLTGFGDENFTMFGGWTPAFAGG